MNKLDQQIRDTLRKEDAELFDALPTDQSLPQMLIDSFRGKHWWLIVIVFFWSLVFFIASIYCAVQFFTVEDLRHQMWWGAGMFFGQMVVGMLKMWYWMELNKNATIREVKRVELQIALLAKRLAE